MTDVHPFCIRFKGETIHYKCSSIFESVSKGNINHPLKWKIIHYISSLEGKKINHPLKPPCPEKIIHYRSSSISSVSNGKTSSIHSGGVKGGNQCEREKTGVCVCVSCLRDRRVGTCPWRWWSGALAILQ
jgi:hypothetical protein